MDSDYLEKFEVECTRITKQINEALISIDGETHLPMWLQQYVHSPVFTISADTLQGIKIGLKIASWRLQEITGEKDGKEEGIRKV